MDKTLLIYKSKTGFTERYARWIAEELGCDLLPYGERNRADFTAYGTVIYGGYFHAGLISGLKWFKGKYPLLAGKRIVVFAVGAMPQDGPDVDKCLRQNFTGEEWEKTKVFYLQGGLRYDKMGKLDKFMMSAFAGHLKKTEGEYSEIYKMVTRSYDISGREWIKPLVEYCRK